MPSKLRLRYVFRPVVKLIAKGLSKIGVSPNFATIIMFAFAISSVIFLLFMPRPLNLVIFAILIFITGIMDGVDGAIARLTDKSTQFGGFFDSVMDRLSEFVIFFGLLIYCWNQKLWTLIDVKLIVLTSFLATLMISYMRSRAENFYRGDFDVGIMGRSERLFFLFISALIAYFYGYYNELLFLFMLLVIGTAIFRYIKISQQLKLRKNEVVKTQENSLN